MIQLNNNWIAKKAGMTVEAVFVLADFSADAGIGANGAVYAVADMRPIQGRRCDNNR